MKNREIACKNCEKEFKEGFAFCPHCGQKAKDDLTLGVLFYNTISNYFSFDARFFKSFFPLLLKPGYLASRFIEGKRLLYLHPAQLYLFVSVVFFFLLSTVVVRNQVQEVDAALKETINKKTFNKVDKEKVEQTLDSVQLDSVLKPLKGSNIPDSDQANISKLDSIIQTSSNNDKYKVDFGFNRKKIDSLIAINATDNKIHQIMGMDEDAGYLERKFYEKSLKFYKQRNGGQIIQAIYDTIPIALFILLPIFAFILKALFIKHGQYAHHLVFSFYFFSFLFLVFSIILIVNYILNVPDWIDWVLVLSTFFYLFVAIKRFYKHGWFLSYIKTSLVTLIYFIFVIPIAFVLIAFTGFMFY